MWSTTQGNGDVEDQEEKTLQGKRNSRAITKCLSGCPLNDRLYILYVVMESNIMMND